MIKKLHLNFFKIVSIFTSVLFAYLFFTLLLNTDSFIRDLGVQPCESSLIAGRRSSIFMLGISVLMLGSINLPNSKARQVICLATGITMFGLACMGSYEFIRGTVNTSILTAITIETILGISFMIIFFINSMTKKS
jgi:hypothetical protein